MELIPILAFIVLVATIATFIFAFAAYVLFKIRESRGKATASQPPQMFQAEFVIPETFENINAQYASQMNIQQRKTRSQADSEKDTESDDAPKYMRYTARGYLPVSKSKDGDDVS